MISLSPLTPRAQLDKAEAEAGTPDKVAVQVGNFILPEPEPPAQFLDESAMADDSAMDETMASTVPHEVGRGARADMQVGLTHEQAAETEHYLKFGKFPGFPTPRVCAAPRVLTVQAAARVAPGEPPQPSPPRAWQDAPPRSQQKLNPIRRPSGGPRRLASLPSSSSSHA